MLSYLFVGDTVMIFSVIQVDRSCNKGRKASSSPRILQPRHPVEHHFPAHPMVLAIRHKVAMTFKLELLIGLRGGQ